MPLKRSKQRELIKAFLMGRKDHPTADVIYTHVRQQLPSISLGTVYRNLALLCETGEIRRLHLDDGLDHFDADCRPHYHFLCRKCGKVEDYELQESQISHLDRLGLQAPRDFSGRLEGHTTYFYGLCAHCAQEAQTQEGLKSSAATTL